MEKTERNCRQFMGGIASGIGIAAMLAAAIEQYTRYNLKNFTILTMALGLAAIILGLGLARASSGRSEPEKP